MSKQKKLRLLHGIVAACTVVPLVVSQISTKDAVTILAIVTALKEFAMLTGDQLDDGKLNKSFAALALAGLLCFGSGCMNMPATVRALSKDKAKVKIEISTIYGKATLERDGTENQ